MTELFNPFTGETVEVSKAGYGGAGYPDALKGNPMIGHTRQIGSLLPTGKHVSHANDLHVTRKGKRTSVGRYGDTSLRRYKGGGKQSTGLLAVKKRDQRDRSDESRVTNYARRGALGGLATGAGLGAAGGAIVASQLGQEGFGLSRKAKAGLSAAGAVNGGARLGILGGLGGAGIGALAGPYKKPKGRVSKSFEDLGDLSRQPGMINPGVQTSSWSHGTPNQNFAAASGRRGSKIR